MNAEHPIWVEVLTGALMLTGSVAALIGSFGVLRLKTFFQRAHAPTLGSTVGTWSLALATAVQVSFAHGQLFVHALLIGAFIALTAPITTIFLMRAAVFRQRQRIRESAEAAEKH